MIKNTYAPFFMRTDLSGDISLFDDVDFSDGWVDANVLYKDYVEKATSGKQMNKFFVKEIKKMNNKSLRFLSHLFQSFNIRPREYRCDFFKVLPGGSLPYHIDQKSKISFCLPLTENTCYTCFKEDDVEIRIKYDSLIVLNNLILHKVTPPEKERILFRVGVHDISFEELLERNI